MTVLYSNTNSHIFSLHMLTVSVILSFVLLVIALLIKKLLKENARNVTF